MEEALTYRLETFEGPLDLLLALIKKNKMKIDDIKISVICEQYLDYIARAAELDMDLAAEFIETASELMLIKSRMLLPRETEEEEDPRARLAEAIARLAAAKKAAAILGERYKLYCGRLEKEPEDISPDRSYVADQDPARLYEVMRRVLSEVRDTNEAAGKLVTTIVSRPVVSVELKIYGILKHFGDRERSAPLSELLLDADSRPEVIAIFIGVLELLKLGRLVLASEDGDPASEGPDALLRVNPGYTGDLTAGIELDDYSGAPSAAGGARDRNAE
jgi:segregation and condensation protein A